MSDLATATGRAICRLANDLEAAALVPGGCADRLNLEALGVAFWTLLLSLTILTLGDWLLTRTNLRCHLADGWRGLLRFAFELEHPTGGGRAPARRGAPSSAASEAGRGGERESLRA